MADENTKSVEIIDSALLDSIQGSEFKETGSGLKEFKGKVVQWSAHQNLEYNSVSIKLLFSNIDIILADSPLQKDEFTIWIPNSEYKGSKKHIFMESLTKFIQSKTILNDIVGKTLHMKLVEHPIYDGKQKKKVPTGCWEVMGIVEGGNTGTKQLSVDPGVRALEMIIGKTDNEFKAIALTDSIISKDAELKGSIIHKDWQNMMLESGSIILDENGRYQYPA